LPSSKWLERVFNILCLVLGLFVSLVSTTFKLPYQRFSTLNQATLQPLERPYDLWNTCNLNGGEW
jgi:hypothetical protein